MPLPRRGEMGILTLATSRDYAMAIALAQSLKLRSPNMPVAVACPPAIRKKLEPHFDSVINKLADVKESFVQKLYLDKYSPYERTLFLDADMLVFKDPMPIFEKWKGSPYAARGWYVSSGISSFGADREKILKMIGRDKLVCIDGAGHAYFEKPGCFEVFEKAREIAKNYRRYSNPCSFADEDVMNIALTLLSIEPKPNKGFLGSPRFAVPGTFRMDALEGTCSYIDKLDKETGAITMPMVVHFMRRATPILYARELERLRRYFELRPRIFWWWPPLLSKIRTDFFWGIKHKMKTFCKKALSL